MAVRSPGDADSATEYIGDSFGHRPHVEVDLVGYARDLTADVVDRQSKDDLGPAPGGDCHLLGVCGVRKRDGSGRGGPHGGGAVEHRVGTAGATIWLNGWLNSG